MAGSKIKFKHSVRYYEINGVKMYDGLMDNNPFYKVLNLTKTAQWILHNSDQVYSKIYKELKIKPNQQVSYGVNSRDVFEYILNYYLEHPEKDFQEYYMGEDADYKIAQYVLSSVRNLIRVMRGKDDMSKLGPILGIVDDGEFSDDYKPLTVMSSKVSTTQDTDVIVNKQYYSEVFDYLSDLVREAVGDDTLSKEFIFDLVFHSITEVSEESLLEVYGITNKYWVKCKGSLVKDEELAGYIREQLIILAEPVVLGQFTEEDLHKFSMGVE